MNQNNAFVLSIFESFPNFFFTWRNWFSKTHINNFSTIIYRISYCICNIFISFVTIRNSSHRHYFCYFISNSILRFSTLRKACNNARNVSSVFSIWSFVMIISVIFFVNIIIIISYNTSGIVVQIILFGSLRFKIF